MMALVLSKKVGGFRTSPLVGTWWCVVIWCSYENPSVFGCLYHGSIQRDLMNS